MTAAMKLLPTQQVLFDALAAAAADGVACPANEDLAELIGSASASAVVSVMKRLEEQGVIRVNRYAKGREVQIVSSGAVTAYDGPREPHWRHRGRPLHDFGGDLPPGRSIL